MANPINPYSSLQPGRLVKYSAEQTKTPASTPAASSQTPAVKGQPDVHVHLSQTEQQLRQVGQQLANQPEIDHTRVQALRQQIDAGTYQISAERIAERILESEHLMS